MNINTIVKTYACTAGTTVPAHSRSTSHHAAACRLFDIAHSIRRAGEFFAALTIHAHDKLDLIALSRIRSRVDGLAQLLSEAAKAAKLLGFDKNAPFINIKGEMIGLQEASRRVRAIQVELKGKKAGEALGGTLGPLGVGDPPRRPGDPPKGIYVDPTKITFDSESDDKARRLVSEKSPQSLQEMPDHELVRLIEDMLSGPTGDEDEGAILKILESCDCTRRARLVGQVGLDRLLSDLDGREWDRLVVMLVDCGIIGFDKMDDDASRRFVNSHSCSQLGVLNMNSVRQLVLNMFSGSCGDDDEDAILKLLGCQSTPRLQQLVGMPGTDVGEFDYNFDGDQWDDLEAFFAANGITLDP